MPSMPVEVGTKFQSHYHNIPLPPNHSFTTDGIGPPIALTMTVIMISPLIWGYKYRRLEKRKGGGEVPKVLKSREREREKERERERVNWRVKPRNEPERQGR